MERSVSIHDLWKEYRIGGPARRGDTFHEAFGRFVRSPVASVLRRINAHRAESFWALRAVDLEVETGQVIGVIGRNGAGKSTLLKVLSRITAPTRGRIEVRGRLASLLEVGTGFHPELTGRENIFLNGAILGMTRREIATKFDEIVAFAEVETFLDTPVKRYSSGMYVRLAFAVAAHLEPDVLVVDEVLAVGDASFQKKCLAKIGEVRGEGRTVFFVSHNMTAIRQLCTSAVLLERGSVSAQGAVSDVLESYLSSTDFGAKLTWSDPDQAPGNDRIRLRSVRLLCAGQETSEVAIDSELQVEIEFWNRVEGIRNLAVFCNLRDALGGDVLVSFNTDAASTRKTGWYDSSHSRGLYRAVCTIPPNLLNDQTYSVLAQVVSMTPWSPEAVAEPLSFTVRDSGLMREPGMYGQWNGSVRPQLDWNTEKVAELDRSEPSDALRS